MASVKFIKILDAATESKVYQKTMYAANRWFREKTARFRGGNARITDIETMNPPQAPALLKRELVGNLFYFTYDPKTAKSLPYYDRFPLVMPIELEGDGFLGVNYHYLHPMERALLMDRILEAFDAPTDELRVLNRSRLSYSTLDNFGSRYKYFKPALKKYLFTRIKSRMIELEEAEWKVALFLPSYKFVGARPQKVWADSRKKARGN